MKRMRMSGKVNIDKKKYLKSVEVHDAKSGIINYT